MARFSTVMVIDDSEMDNFLIKIILESLDYSDKILTYTNPSSALTYLKNLAAGNGSENEFPAIIFLDINMPIMTGFDFLDKFNEFPKPISGSTRFYIVSSSEDPEDMGKIKLYNNVIKYLYKPVDKSQLI